VSDDASQCTCSLLDVSTITEIRFIRGFSNGCPIHPPTEYELRVREAEEHQRRLIDAAKRRAREAP
jgi:hypothetical protein